MPQTLSAGNTGVQSRTDDVDTGRVSFHVDGDASLDGRLHLKECLADTFLKVSDKRLKKDIVPIHQDESIQIVQQLNPVNFKYRSSGDKSIGYIAQDVESIHKDLVKKNSGGMYSLDYGSLSVHTTTALQALLKRVEELESKLEPKLESKQ